MPKAVFTCSSKGCGPSHATNERRTNSFQYSLDQCPMLIYADQNSGIDPNVDQFRLLPINVNQFRLRGIDRH